MTPVIKEYPYAIKKCINKQFSTQKEKSKSSAEGLKLECIAAVK